MTGKQGADGRLRVLVDTKQARLRAEIRDIASSVAGVVLVDEDGSGVDVLIKEIGEDPAGDFGAVAALLASGEVGEAYLTSPRTDPELLIQAMRTGAREFFPQPLKGEEVQWALQRAVDWKRKSSAPVRGRLGRVIDVVGSKGGVGATTVAVNLASGLSAAEGVESVALIDMNLLFGEVPLFLDMEPAFNWGEVVRNIERLDSAYLMGVLSRHASGIYVLPSPTRLDGVSVATPEIIERILNLMKHEFDYIVVDGGQSLDSLSLKVIEMSDSLLLVSILSLPCLINTRRLIDTFGALGYPRDSQIQIVMNRHHKNSIISAREAEKGVGRPISWMIPNDYQTTMSAINQGKMISDVAAKSDIAESYRLFANETAERRKTEK